MQRSPKLDASFWWRRSAGFLVFVMLACVAALSVGAPLADAQQDLMDVTSDTTYHVDVTNENVRVDGTYSFRNNLAPRDLGNGTTEHSFFTTYHFIVPQSARDFTAQADGVVLEATFLDRDFYDIAEVRFPQDLRYSDTLTLNVSYVIPDSGPRSDWGHAEISSDYLELSLWAQGSPGQSTVRVVLPSDYSVDLVGEFGVFAEASRSGEQVLTASGIADAGDFRGQLLAYNENVRLENTSMTIHSGTAVVLSRPSDTEWRDFVVDSLRNDLPVLERLIGIPWPHGNVVVEQSNEPRRDGFGGWYDSSHNTIKFESASREVLLHEFSHGWFNGQFSRDRWINEGLSEELASRTIEARGGERPDPSWPDPTDSVRIPLGVWVRPATVSNDAERRAERYHYDASWWVFRQITNDIGMDAFSDVLVEFNAVTASADRNWRTLFELLDQTAVDDQLLDTQFGTYVSPSGIDVFQQRRAVLASLDVIFDEHGFGEGGFEMPAAITRHIRAWEWAQARPLVDDFAAFVPRMIELRERAAASSIDISYYERLFTAAQDDTEFARIDDFIAIDIAAMDQLDTDRAAVQAAADQHGLVVDFDLAALGIAERHTQVAQQAIDNIAADRALLVASAADAGVTIRFRPESTVETAASEIDGLRLQLSTYVARREVIDGRMAQLGLRAPSTTTPLSLRLADRQLNEQASMVAALASLTSVIQEMTDADQDQLVDKRSAASVIDEQRASETAPTESVAAQPTEVAVASSQPIATSRSPILPAALSLMLLGLGAIATVMFVKARRAPAAAGAPEDSLPV